MGRISMADRDYVYDAELGRVIDGDTVDVVLLVECDLGFGDSMIARKPKRLRLKDLNGDTYFDTPEIGSHARNKAELTHGEQAKKFVEDCFASASVVEVKTYKDHTGKYGRALADVFLDSVSLVHLLDANGFRKRATY